MPYYVEALDKSGSSELRAKVRPDHLGYLLQNEKTLLACGALLTDDGQNAIGSVYLLAVETRAEAEQMIANDPYVKADLFESIKIVRWRKSFLDGKSYL